MASKAVMDAIEARVATWSSIGTYPLAEPNEVAASPAVSWLAIEYPVAHEERITLGQPALYRESGAILCVLHVTINTAIDAAAAAVETLRDLLRDKDDFSGVPALLTFEASPATFDKRNRDGAFYRVPFTVAYQFDIEK